MNLFINSPSYYTQINGVCDEIYQMCLVISKNIDVTKYTTALDSIGITPIIVPEAILENGKWKEEKKVSTTYRYASISLITNYYMYEEAAIAKKKEMILENILKSLFEVKKLLKNNFDYSKIEKDIIEIVHNQSTGDD